MNILSKIWHILTGTAASRGAVETAAPHALDGSIRVHQERSMPQPTAVEVEVKTAEVRVSPAAPETNPIPPVKKSAPASKPPAGNKRNSKQGKQNGNVRHKRKDSSVGK